MMRSILAGAVFVGIVLVPCVIAMISKANEADNSSDPNVFEEGFI